MCLQAHKREYNVCQLNGVFGTTTLRSWLDYVHLYTNRVAVLNQTTNNARVI